MSRIKTIAAAVSAAALVAACGGGGGGGSGGGSGGASQTDTTVAPSLGKFTSGCGVEAFNGAGLSLGKATIGANGTAVLKVPSDVAPLIVQVQGNAGCQYYDEGTNTQLPFGAAKVLNAVVPAVRTEIGVNALTHIAAARVTEGADKPKVKAGVSATQVREANKTVELMFGVLDMFNPPVLLDGSTTIAATDGEKGVLAAKLAALAVLANANGGDAAKFADDLARDLIENNGFTTLDVLAFESALTTVLADDKLTKTEDAEHIKSRFGELTTSINEVQTRVDNVLKAGTSLEQAKSMFASLRSSVLALSNSAGTGTLDKEAKLLDEDVKGSFDVAQQLDRVVLMMDAAVQILDKGESYFYGPAGYCQASMEPGKMTCSFYMGNPWKEGSHAYEAEVTANGFGQATWKVTSRYTWQYDASGAITGWNATPLTGLNGTLLHTPTTSSGIASLTGSATGRFIPMSADSDYTQVAVDLKGSSVEGRLTGEMSGTVSLKAMRNGSATPVLTAELTKIAGKVDEANLDAASATLEGALISARHRFDGTLVLAGLQRDLAAQELGPTAIDLWGYTLPKKLTFNGSFTNTASNFKVFEGSLVATADASKWDSRLPPSIENYLGLALTFSGKIYRAPNSLGVGFDLTAKGNRMGPEQVDFVFTGLNGLRINGIGKPTLAGGPENLVWELRNENGIRVHYNDFTKLGTVSSEAGIELGKIGNDRVTFIDGAFESLI